MYVQTPETPDNQLTHVVFREASWNLYETILREYDEDPTRVNYDQGTLEIMTLSFEHENYKEWIGQLIGLISMEFSVPVARGGSTTLKMNAKEKGLEPDQCFWIAGESTVRGLKRIDLAIHPPPDLVVEIDITHAVVNRESIYAAIGVPEMWHFDTQTMLTAWELVDGNWNRIEHSKSLPMVRVADLNPFLRRFQTEGDVPVLRDFRDWLHTLPR